MLTDAQVKALEMLQAAPQGSVSQEQWEASVHWATRTALDRRRYVTHDRVLGWKPRIWGVATTRAGRKALEEWREAHGTDHIS